MTQDNSLEGGKPDSMGRWGCEKVGENARQTRQMRVKKKRGKRESSQGKKSSTLV